MNKKVVYTSVFGKFDNIEKLKLPDDWDFKYFSEDNSIPLYEDSNRNAKRYKILPHRYLSDYEISIYIDGNFRVIGDIDKLVESYLSDSNIAFYNHKNTTLDPRQCVYEEADIIFHFGRINTAKCQCIGECIGHYKDNPDIIKKQIDRYKEEGYPKNNGLIKGGIILRRHNEKDIVQTMEDWWTEIKYNSKRDQLSFNYTAWKNNLNFNYIDGDQRNNDYFLNLGAHIGKK